MTIYPFGDYYITCLSRGDDPPRYSISTGPRGGGQFAIYAALPSHGEPQPAGGLTIAGMDVIGFMRVESDKTGANWFIDNVEIDPEHRRKGVATNLLAVARRDLGHHVEHGETVTPGGEAFARAVAKWGMSRVALAAGDSVKDILVAHDERDRWDRARWEYVTLPIPPMRTEAGMRRVASGGVYFHGSRRNFSPGTELRPLAELKPEPYFWQGSYISTKAHFVWMCDRALYTDNWAGGSGWNYYIVRPNGQLWVHNGGHGDWDNRYFAQSAVVLDGPFAEVEEVERFAAEKHGWSPDQGSSATYSEPDELWEEYGVPRQASRWGLERTAITESWEAVRGGAAPDPGDGEGSITVSGREPEFLWRIMSAAEWESAQANGYIQSSDGYTHAATYPAWKFHDGPTPGQRIVKVRYDASDGWKQATNLDGDTFAVTHQSIPLSRVVAVTPPAVARDFADNLGGGGHRWGLKHTAIRYDEFPSELPPEPGTAPIPSGAVRLYHYTEPGNLANILANGLRVDSAKGNTYGEPSVVWASGKMPDPGVKSFVEVWAIPSEDLIVGRDAGGDYLQSNDVTFIGDVSPDRIVSYSEPWIVHARYLLDNEMTESVKSGEYDHLASTSGYGKAIEWVKRHGPLSRWGMQNTATMPLGWRGSDPEAQWSEPTIRITAVWPGWVGFAPLMGESQPISYRDRKDFGRFIGQAEQAAYDHLERQRPADVEKMTGFVLSVSGSSKEVHFGYSGADWQQGFVWQEPDAAPRQWVKNPSREMWWAMQYGDGDKFSEVLSIDAVGVYPHDLVEPVLEPMTLEVYRGLSLFAEDDPLSVEKDGGGTGSSWSTSLDVAMAIAERGMAGFTSYNVPGDIYESWHSAPPNLGNGRWNEVEDYDKTQWTPVVLRAEVTITPGPGQTDPAFYYPFGASYASEQEVDIPRGSEVRITGYKRAGRKPYGNGDYIQWDWPSSWTSANVVRTASSDAQQAWEDFYATNPASPMEDVTREPAEEDWPVRKLGEEVASLKDGTPVYLYAQQGIVPRGVGASYARPGTYIFLAYADPGMSRDQMGTLEVSEDETPGQPRVMDVLVKDEYQRKGVATLLWHLARKYVPNLEHSSLTTFEGDGWIRTLSKWGIEASQRLRVHRGLRIGWIPLDDLPFDVLSGGDLPRDFVMEMADRLDIDRVGHHWTTDLDVARQFALGTWPAGHAYTPRDAGNYPGYAFVGAVLSADTPPGVGVPRSAGGVLLAEGEVNFPDGTELQADRVGVYLWTPDDERSGHVPISPPVSVFTSPSRIRGASRVEAGSSWRPYAASTFWEEYPVVVHTDGGPSGRKSYDVYAQGQQVASRPTLTEAKLYVEDALGPQEWQTKRLDKVTIDHYWWGLTDEFSSPTTVYVVPHPTGDVSALNRLVAL